MRKFFLPLMLAIAPVSLSGCAGSGAISGTVTISTDKAIVVTQTAFVTAQNVALTMIHNGQITGANKNKVIDLLDKGADLETKIHDTRDSAAIKALAGVISDLSALGVKGN